MAVTRRSQARMLALQALCAFDAVGDPFETQLDELLRDPQAHADLQIERLSATLLDFARALALGTWKQRKTLDEKLAQTAAHWSLARMTPVDRNILRIGLHELLEHPETPPQVVINEAIELARRFGDADSPGFVNGVLDAVRRACGIPAEPKVNPATSDSAQSGVQDGEKGDDGSV